MKAARQLRQIPGFVTASISSSLSAELCCAWLGEESAEDTQMPQIARRRQRYLRWFIEVLGWHAWLIENHVHYHTPPA